VRDHSCLIVTDDIYERLLYRPEPFLNIVNVSPELLDRTLVVNGMSKAFAMTGWRLGYGAGPKPVLKAMELIQDQSTSNTNSIAQKAAVAALRGPEDEMAKMVAEFKARRDRIVTLLNQIPGVSCRKPDGAFYVFPNIQRLIGKRFDRKPITSSMDAAEILLTRFKLGTVPGLPFGGEGHLRLSFAASRAAIEKGLARLADFASAVA
jgi:aspartate aminotransferase